MGRRQRFAGGASSPPAAPRLYDDKPAPCPKPKASRPRKSGKLNVVWPLPPKVVPRSAKSAWFWLIGRVCPAHNAHPRGAKLKLKASIIDINGFDIRSPPPSMSRSRVNCASERFPATRYRNLSRGKVAGCCVAALHLERRLVPPSPM